MWSYTRGVVGLGKVVRWPKGWCKGGGGYDFKRQTIVKKMWQKKWSGHGQTSRTADYGPGNASIFCDSNLKPSNSRPARHVHFLGRIAMDSITCGLLLHI